MMMMRKILFFGMAVLQFPWTSNVFVLGQEDQAQGQDQEQEQEESPDSTSFEEDDDDEFCFIGPDLYIRTLDGIQYNLNDGGTVGNLDAMSYKLGRAFHFHIRTSNSTTVDATNDEPPHLEAISLASLIGDWIEINAATTPTQVLYNGKDVTGQPGPFEFWGYQMTINRFHDEHGGPTTVYHMQLDSKDYVHIMEDQHGLSFEAMMPTRSEGLCGPGLFGRGGESLQSGADMANHWQLLETDPRFFSVPLQQQQQQDTTTLGQNVGAPVGARAAASDETIMYEEIKITEDDTPGVVGGSRPQDLMGESV